MNASFNKYRPLPFWSWNEKLSVNDSLRQTKLMDEAGIGGYFMHARGGLQTEYMGDEWFRNVAACIDECNSRGMRPWHTTRTAGPRALATAGFAERAKIISRSF